MGALQFRIYLAAPRLRGVLALSITVSALSAMVIVNTAMHVKSGLSGDDALVAAFFGAYGVGSAVVAFALRRVLERVSDRTVMLHGAFALALGLAIGALGVELMDGLALWALLGAGTAAVSTPVGLALRRSCTDADRTAVFAAQFALSHAGWLAAYPAAGVLGASYGLNVAFGIFALIPALAAALAVVIWPEHDPTAVPHTHPRTTAAGTSGMHCGLAPACSAGVTGGEIHSHPFVIDDLHPTWPRRTSPWYSLSGWQIDPVACAPLQNGVTCADDGALRRAKRECGAVHA